MVLSRKNCCGCCLILLRKLYVSVLRTNHYKTLGLSPSATQAQIKSAYYELSKKHHPDRNQGSEKSAKIFRSITEAYEILGNEKLRKHYDESHPWSTANETNDFDTPPKGDYNDDLERMYYERRYRRFHRRYYGKTPYYDFDTWYRAHYGKNSNFDSDAWFRGPFGRRPSFEFDKEFKEFKFEGTSKFYRKPSDTVKNQDAFIKKSENIFLLIFYTALVVLLLSRM